MSSETQLAADPFLHRFTVVFDREGYSPALFARLKEKRIAILSYHKHPGEDWPAAEFQEREVTLINGEKATLQLAERWTVHPNSIQIRMSEPGNTPTVSPSDHGWSNGGMTPAPSR